MYEKKKLRMKFFYQKKQVNISFPSSSNIFFFNFQHFLTIDFFFLISKTNFVGKFFSYLLQYGAKNAIFNFKTKIIKKNKNLSIEFFFSV